MHPVSHTLPLTSVVLPLPSCYKNMIQKHATKTKANKQNKPGLNSAASQLVRFLYLILATIQSCLFWASVLKDTLNDYLPKHTHNVLWAGSANHLTGMLKGIVWPEGSTGEVWGSRQAMHESDQKSSVKGCGGQAVEVRLRKVLLKVIQ